MLHVYIYQEYRLNKGIKFYKILLNQEVYNFEAELERIHTRGDKNFKKIFKGRGEKRLDRLGRREKRLDMVRMRRRKIGYGQDEEKRDWIGLDKETRDWIGQDEETRD